MSAPSPPPERATYDTDPRIAMVQAGIDMMPAEMLVRHPMSATRPEQCNGLFDWTFINQAWMASYDIPSYRDWFLDADYAPAYEAHRAPCSTCNGATPAGGCSSTRSTCCRSTRCSLHIPMRS